MKAVALTDVGKMRENNEDFYMIHPSQRLFVIADGMGGYHAGEIAAEIAAKSIVSAFESDGHGAFEKEAMRLLNTANEEIMTYVKDHPDCRGMGTTVVMVAIFGDALWVVNVGDSRCYGLEDGKLVQLTEDHSLVAELVKMGSISAEEAERHPDRNIVTSALGVDQKFDVFIKSFELKSFSHLLLCSDGLSNMVSARKIESVLKELPIEEVPTHLVSLANQFGGKDNITVIGIAL